MPRKFDMKDDKRMDEDHIYFSMSEIGKTEELAEKGEEADEHELSFDLCTDKNVKYIAVELQS